MPADTLPGSSFGVDAPDEIRLVSERRRPLPAVVEGLRDEILDMSRFLLAHPELSSEEHQAHDRFVARLGDRGFAVTPRYLGMDTAFAATIGSGRPAIALFAEYDALPNGHACGHNVVSAFAYGVALALAASEAFDGAVHLFGTPAEEGIGPWASSKAVMAAQMTNLGIDAAFFAHPKGDWNIGAATLSKSRTSFVFTGREGSASRPEAAVNALDAAVEFYVGLRMLRSSLPLRKYVVLLPVIVDGGLTSKLLVPGRAEVWVEVKADDDGLATELRSRMDTLARAAATGVGASVEISDVTPPVAALRRYPLEETYHRAALRYLTVVNDPDTVWATPVEGMSADIGNISQVVPTGYLGIKIGRRGIVTHSDEFAEMAAAPATEEAILTAVAIGYEAIVEYARSVRSAEGT